MSEHISAQFGERYVQEVQFFSQAETDPYERGMMLAARMEAGDDIDPRDLVRQYLLSDPQMWGIQKRQPDASAKLELGMLTVDALLAQQHYLPLYHLSSSRSQLIDIQPQYIHHRLLRNGYAGPHDELLRLYTADFFLDPTIDRQEALTRRYRLHEHLAAVAAYGIDLRDTNSEHGLLLAAVLTIGSDALDRDLGLYQVARSYAEGGKQLDLAWHFQDQITHPSLRHRTSFAIAAASDTTEALQRAADSVDETAIGALHCPGGCSYFNCNPISNHAELSLEAARVHARLGDIETARRFAAASSETSVVLDAKRLAASAALYQVSGLATDRAGVLSFINNSVTPLSEAQSIIRSTSQTDLCTGRTLPLSDAGEDTPLIAWELAAAFGRPNREELRPDIEDILQDYYQERRSVRFSRLLGELAVHLGEQELPAGADHVLKQIARPVDRVRAMTMLARIYSVLNPPAIPKTD